MRSWYGCFYERVKIQKITLGLFSSAHTHNSKICIHNQFFTNVNCFDNENKHFVITISKAILPQIAVCENYQKGNKKEFTIQLLEVVFDLAIERRIKSGAYAYVCVCI